MLNSKRASSDCALLVVTAERTITRSVSGALSSKLRFVNELKKELQA